MFRKMGVSPWKHRGTCNLALLPPFPPWKEEEDGGMENKILLHDQKNQGAKSQKRLPPASSIQCTHALLPQGQKSMELE